jgi:hypothetical protein
MYAFTPGSPQRRSDAAGDLVFAASLGMALYGLAQIARDRREKLLNMTPPEIVAFRKGTPRRVLKRVIWIAVATWGTITIAPNPWAYIFLVGFPLWNFIRTVQKQRRFVRSRALAWDAWYRTKDTTLADVDAWWYTASWDARDAFTNWVREEQAWFL